ncbi:RNA polymerase sigma-70 factor [Niabella aquatica]
MDIHEVSILIEDLKKDDRQAFDKLFRQYYVRLVKFATTFLDSRQSAEDAVSVFFMRLWKKRKILPVIKSPETYFYTAVKNTCLNYKRDFKFKTMPYQQEEILSAGLQATHQQPIELKELKYLIEKAVQTLPGQRRLIFRLVKENGLKCREVAEILSLSVRTVETQLHKAVKTLADEISHHIGYNPQQKGAGRNLKLLLLLM